MFEVLKELAIGDMLTIDDAEVERLSDSRDFDVAGVRCYSQEEGEVVVVDLDGLFLVAHTLGGEPRYAVYEEYSAGSPDDLSDDGFRLAPCDADALPRKVYAGRADREAVYKAAVAVYGLATERDDPGDDEAAGDVSFCEYRGRGRESQAARILLERGDDRYTLYQGFPVSEASLLP